MIPSDANGGESILAFESTFSSPPFFPPVMTRGTAFSPPYRFTLSDGTVLNAHTKCKLCCPQSPEMQPFIMGIHIIER